MHFAKLNRHTAADQELTPVQTKTQATLVLDYDSLVLELGQVIVQWVFICTHNEQYFECTKIIVLHQLFITKDIFRHTVIDTLYKTGFRFNISTSPAVLAIFVCKIEIYNRLTL